MPMTFAEWRATRKDYDALPEDEAVGYEGRPGHAYEAGFIVKTADGFMVPIQHDELTFATLELAEDHLWLEWCGPEINGAA